jgi:hypothetical protein
LHRWKIPLVAAAPTALAALEAATLLAVALATAAENAAAVAAVAVALGEEVALPLMLVA